MSQGLQWTSSQDWAERERNSAQETLAQTLFNVLWQRFVIVVIALSQTRFQVLRHVIGTEQSFPRLIQNPLSVQQNLFALWALRKLTRVSVAGLEG